MDDGGNGDVKPTIKKLEQLMKDKGGFNTAEVEAVNACGEGLTLRSWRDVSIAVSRKHMHKEEGRFRESEEDWDHEEDDDEMEDLQAGHGSHVAGAVYARSIREGDGMLASTRQKFRRVSENWHRVLGFEVPGASTAVSGKRKGGGSDARD
ncbi:hypothetical protein G7Y79_00024g055310 [Physcia stellaris]|nr:hypothetical protein G7Y79_00024g055310 [Physcia stellaris]